MGENIMEETKTITKSTKMAVEESFVSLKEEAEGKHDSDEKLLKNKDNSDTETGSKYESPNQKDASIEKSESVLKTVVSKESSVMVTKTDTRSYSDVLKSEKSIESKHEIVKTIDSARKEKDEKDAAIKKEKEDKLKKEQANKKEISEQKNTDKNIKKKTSTVTTKIRTKETITKTKRSEVTNDLTSSSTSSRKIMPAKPSMTKSSTPPSSKLKKDENNKKVMETRKAAFAAKSQKSKTDSEEKTKSKRIIGSKIKNISGPKSSGKTSSTLADEERKVDEKSVAEKVSEAIASGEIDDSRVVKDDDEDKESIVEKDQIEDMETCPVDDLETGKDFVKDNEYYEDAIELQRIKDEDDEVEENLAPVPDIAEKINDVTKEKLKRDAAA